MSCSRFPPRPPGFIGTKKKEEGVGGAPTNPFSPPKGAAGQHYMAPSKSGEDAQEADTEHIRHAPGGQSHRGTEGQGLGGAGVFF